MNNHSDIFKDVYKTNRRITDGKSFPDLKPAPFDAPKDVDDSVSRRIHEMASQDFESLTHACDILRRLLNAAWGTTWGVIMPEASTGVDPDNITLPCIIVDMNNREVQDKKPLKPTLIHNVKEVCNGHETGDVFQVYRQWYDCVLEFNFYGRNTKECRELMHNFESLMIAAAGILKKEGIAEFFFLKEVSPKQSVNYHADCTMCCAMFYYRFEVDFVTRTSMLDRIKLEFGERETFIIE